MVLKRELLTKTSTIQQLKALMNTETAKDMDGETKTESKYLQITYCYSTTNDFIKSERESRKADLLEKI